MIYHPNEVVLEADKTAPSLSQIVYHHQGGEVFYYYCFLDLHYSLKKQPVTNPPSFPC